MKNLIIIGAGGYGREMSEFAKEACGYGEEFVVKGFIDGYGGSAGALQRVSAGDRAHRGLCAAT